MAQDAPQGEAGIDRALTMYLGLNGKLEPEGARDLFIRLADEGDPIAIFWTARLEFLGRLDFGDVDFGSAPEERAKGVLKELEKLAEAGDVRASYCVGSAYDLGLGVEQDQAVGREWLLKAALGGDSTAMQNLSVRAAMKSKVELDALVEEMEKDRQAKKLAGEEYPLILKAPIEKVDWTEAAKWSIAASEAGNVWSMLTTSGCYRDGLGVEKDDDIAMKWLLKAAEAGHVDAMLTASRVYRAGIGVDKDDEKSFVWMRRAADAGNLEALKRVAFCHATGTGTPLNLERAVEMWKELGEKGDADSMRYYGLAHLLGEGVPERNEDIAYEWLQRAADAGDPAARIHLESVFGINDGSTSDTLLAPDEEAPLPASLENGDDQED